MIEERVNQVVKGYELREPIGEGGYGVVFRAYQPLVGRDVAVKMTLTAPGCGMGEVLVADVREKLKLIPTVRNADVELVFDPPWNPAMMSEAARLQTGMM